MIIHSQPCHNLSPSLPSASFSDAALDASFYVSLDTALAPGFLLPPLCAASGIALQPMPGWASLWLLFALSTLSSLRQAKIN